MKKRMRGCIRWVVLAIGRSNLRCAAAVRPVRPIQSLRRWFLSASFTANRLHVLFPHFILHTHLRPPSVPTLSNTTSPFSSLDPFTSPITVSQQHLTFPSSLIIVPVATCIGSLWGPRKQPLSRKSSPRPTAAQAASGASRVGESVQTQSRESVRADRVCWLP